MQSADDPESDSLVDGDETPIPCEACQSAIHSENQSQTSFLLLDQLTIPVVSCDDHLEQFTSVCDLTTEDSAELLHHYPAGGICCPGCRNARYSAGYPMIPIHDGAIVVPACPEHQSTILQRFQTGLQTQRQLTASLGTSNTPL